MHPMIFSILIFLGVLLVLVLVHEWGHFIVAKKTGMRVDEFGFGFPPRLFSWKRGETTYSLNLFPIGGFVKIYGEDSLLKSEEERKQDPDYERSFIARSRGAQAAVLFAGVAMNVLLAWVLFAGVFFVGTNETVAEQDRTPQSQLTIIGVSADSAASNASVPAGAEVVSLSRGGAPLQDLTPSAFREFTGSAGETPLTLTYRMSGVEKTVVLAPQRGVIPDEPDRPAIGVAVEFVQHVSYPLPQAVWRGFTTTGSTLVAVAHGLFSFFGKAIIGRADLHEVSGPVGLVKMVGTAAQNGFVSILQFTALISLNLAIINLLPFPALDGGRLLFVGIEAIRRRALSPKLVLYANAAGFFLLLLLMLVVTVSDITKLI